MVLGANVPPSLKGAMFQVSQKLTHEERALLIACIGVGFHGGYSMRLTDEESNQNLHTEYLNAARPVANGSAPR